MTIISPQILLEGSPKKTSRETPKDISLRNPKWEFLEESPNGTHGGFPREYCCTNPLTKFLDEFSEENRVGNPRENSSRNLRRGGFWRNPWTRVVAKKSLKGTLFEACGSVGSTFTSSRKMNMGMIPCSGTCHFLLVAFPPETADSDPILSPRL